MYFERKENPCDSYESCQTPELMDSVCLHCGHLRTEHPPVGSIFILDIGNPMNKYFYNAWTTFRYRDDESGEEYSNDSRLIATDDVEEFNRLLAELVRNPNNIQDYPK